MEIDLNIDNIKNRDEYKEYWDNLSKVEIKCVGKFGNCKHNIGDVFYYNNPYSKPANVCNSLLHVMDLYIWRVTLGHPSWNDEDHRVFKIHCPDYKGTLWEMKKFK